MHANERYLELKRLHQLKSLHFDYCDVIRQTPLKKQGHLPNTLSELNGITRQCYLCELSKTRKNVVFGEGNPQADLMFIGEGPGAMEDESGRPFVGRAGQLLTTIIENVLGLRREDVYIANIVKCRPPQNRVPTPSEAHSCKPYLTKQVELIKPRLIVSLGSTSYHYLTDDKASISRVRGQVFDLWGIQLIPTFHPSYLLRNPSAKKEAYIDFLKVKSLL